MKVSKFQIVYRVKTRLKDSKLPFGHFDIDSIFTTEKRALVFANSLDRIKYSNICIEKEIY